MKIKKTLALMTTVAMLSVSATPTFAAPLLSGLGSSHAKVMSQVKTTSTAMATSGVSSRVVSNALSGIDFSKVNFSAFTVNK